MGVAVCTPEVEKAVETADRGDLDVMGPEEVDMDQAHLA